MQKAVKWYPPSYDIRVEQVPIPRLVQLGHLFRSLRY